MNTFRKLLIQQGAEIVNDKLILKMGELLFHNSTIIIQSIRTDRLSKQCRPRSDAAFAASDLGLHCLPIIQQSTNSSTGNQMVMIGQVCLGSRSTNT